MIHPHPLSVGGLGWSARLGLGQGELGVDGEQFGIGSCQLKADNFGVKDPDLLAEGLNQHEVDALRGFGVEPVRVDEQAQGFVEGAAHGVDLDGPLSDGRLSCGGLARYALLFELELVKCQGVVVVGGLGLGALMVEPGDALTLAGNFLLALGVTTLEFSQDHVLQRLDAILGELDASPIVHDSLLDVGHWDVALRAAVLILLATQAVEVRIGLAGALLGRDGDPEPTTAAGAEQAAFEVVRSSFGFVFVEVAGGQDGIDGVEGGRVDEGLVVAGVLDAAVGHDPEEVPVAQDAVHLLGLQRPFRQTLGRGQPQAQIVGLIRKVADRVQAGGVAAEAVGDDRPGDGIDDDHTDVLAGDLHPLVHVAERGFAGRAARFDFLAHAFLGFFTQIPGVPLGDGGHDAVHQLARRGPVDVLGRRDEFDAVLGEQQAERDVIFTAAG